MLWYGRLKEPQIEHVCCHHLPETSYQVAVGCELAFGEESLQTSGYFVEQGE